MKWITNPDNKCFDFILRDKYYLKRHNIEIGIKKSNQAVQNFPILASRAGIII
jgi:hypothetical protein